MRFPDRFFVSPGVPLVPCPFCGQRPLFLHRVTERQRVRCPVTGAGYVIAPHDQFSVSCTCNDFPRYWGPDLWNTAKGWRRRLADALGSKYWEVEQYEGEPRDGVPALSEGDIQAGAPDWVLCLSPDDTGQQPTPAAIGPAGTYYPTALRFRR